MMTSPPVRKLIGGFMTAAVVFLIGSGSLSALARIFQDAAPFALGLTTGGFHFDDAEEMRGVESPAAAAFQPSIARTAPEWLVNAMPAYSSGRARELWYLSLDRAGDTRLAFIEYGGVNDTSSPYAPTRMSFASAFVQSSGERFASSGGVGPAAPLASGVWIGNSTLLNFWNDPLSWLGDTIADGAGSTADFSTLNIFSDRTVAISTVSRTVGTFLVGDSTAPFNNFSAYTFEAILGEDSTLIFDNSGAGAVLTQTANTGSNHFTVPIVLADNLTINNNAATGTTARSLTISGGITGAFNLTLNANGVNSNTILLDANNPNLENGIPSINNGGTITNSGTGPGTVTISSSIGTNVTGITQASSTSQLTLSGGITLGTDMTLTANGTKLTLISGVISGSHSFTIGGNGTGTTTLSGINTFSNGLTLTNGTLNLNNAAAPGSGTFTINGGTLTNTSGAAITLSNNNAQIWGGDFTYAGGSGSSNLNMGTGSVTLTGNRQVQVSGSTSTLTVGGAIGDGGNNYSLTKVGPGVGTLILSGNSTYTGGTTINAGTLLANNTTGSGTGTGAVTVNNTGTLGGTGFINSGANNITINSGGNITGGTNGTVGTLTLTANTLVIGGTNLVDVNGATADRINLTGNLDITGATIDFNTAVSPTAASYTLIMYSGTLTGTFTNILDLPSGYDLQYNTGEIDLVAVPEPSTWIGAALALAAIGFTQRKRLRRSEI